MQLLILHDSASAEKNTSKNRKWAATDFKKNAHALKVMVCIVCMQHEHMCILHYNIVGSVQICN